MTLLGVSIGTATSATIAHVPRKPGGPNRPLSGLNLQLYRPCDNAHQQNDRHSEKNSARTAATTQTQKQRLAALREGWKAKHGHTQRCTVGATIYAPNVAQ